MAKAEHGGDTLPRHRTDALDYSELRIDAVPGTPIAHDSREGGGVQAALHRAGADCVGGQVGHRLEAPVDQQRDRAGHARVDSVDDHAVAP